MTAAVASPAYAPVQATATVATPTYSNASYSGGTPGGSFGSCVVARESGGNSQVMNSSGHYGLYQFSASTWAAYGGNPASFGNASVAEQNQVFANALAGGRPVQLVRLRRLLTPAADTAGPRGGQRAARAQPSATQPSAYSARGHSARGLLSPRRPAP